MKGFAIFERELQSLARRSLTHRVRQWVTRFGLLVFCLLYLDLRHLPASRIGNLTFDGISMLVWFYALLTGLLTADTLSRERREGTLGLLFLTPLSVGEIVFAKFLAAALPMGYGLMSILPIMMLPVLFGGVSLAQFTTTALCLANTLFFSLAVGLMVSVFSRSERRAFGGSLMVVIALTFGAPILVWVLGWSNLQQPLALWFFLATPMSASTLGLWLFPAAPATLARDSLMVVHGLSWIFLMITIWSLPRLWRESPGPDRSLTTHRSTLARGRESQDILSRQRLLENNPLLWLGVRGNRFSVTCWLAATGLIWFACQQSVVVENLHRGAYLVGAYFLMSVLHCWVAAVSVQMLGADRRSGALELIASLAESVG